MGVWKLTTRPILLASGEPRPLLQTSSRAVSRDVRMALEELLLLLRDRANHAHEQP